METERTTRRRAVDDATSDANLARQVATGSRDALGALFRRHGDAVHALAYRITGTLEDAEDVLQDVFVGLGRALERYEERGRFRSWLLRVAARTALMRRRGRGRSLPEPLDADLGPEGSRQDGLGPLLDRMVVRDALRAMPEPLRVVFVLKEIEGYRHEEIAALLGLTRGASRTRLHRAWRFLHRRVRDE